MKWGGSGEEWPKAGSCLRGKKKTKCNISFKSQALGAGDRPENLSMHSCCHRDSQTI